jgi:Tfp pilus assembly protein PilN
MKAVNLLPSDMRRTTRTTAEKAVAPEPAGAGAFVVLGALALCVAALAAYVLTSNTVKDREAALASTTAEAQAAEQRAAVLKPYADFESMANARVQTVRDLAASRFDWEQALRDVSRAIPGNVTLISLNGTVSSQSGSGGVVRGAIASPAIELSGCTSNQSSVAVVLSQLRAVDGVTRVSLSKSIKPDTAIQPAADGEAEACGAGRPPSFEVVMFFERSTVPATVEDITVAPEATTASADGTTPAADGTVPPAAGTETAAPPAEAPAATDGAAETTPASTGDGS